MLERVVLLGSSSGRNAGDAALMAAIMDGVDRACGRPLRYDIPTPRPRYVREHYPNRTQPVGMMPWQGSLRLLGWPTLRSLLRADAVIVFDAVLFDRALFNPLFNFLSSLYVLLPFAARRGIPILGYNVGVGPVSTRAGRHMLRAVAESMRFITVRDADSLHLLTDVGVRNPRVRLAADAALAAPAWDEARVDRLLRDHGLHPGEPLLGININRYLDSWASAGRTSMGRDAFLHVFSEALGAAADRIDAPFVFVTTQHHDVDITRALMARLPAGVRTVLIDNRSVDHAGIKGVLGRMSLVLGMRLHALIMASAELTPVIGITYQPKVAYYFKELGLPERTLSFDDFSVDSLRDHLLRGWADRAALRAELGNRIPALRARAAGTADLVAALDKGDENLDAAWNAQAGTG